MIFRVFFAARARPGTMMLAPSVAAPAAAPAVCTKARRLKRCPDIRGPSSPAGGPVPTGARTASDGVGLWVAATRRLGKWYADRRPGIKGAAPAVRAGRRPRRRRPGQECCARDGGRPARWGGRTPPGGLAPRPPGSGLPAAARGSRRARGGGARVRPPRAGRAGSPAERGQHLLDAGELDPGAARGAPPGHLQLVEPAPVTPRHELGLALPDHRLGGDGVRVGRRQRPPGGRVLEHARHGLGRIGLVGADDPRRPALDPPRRVLADPGLAAVRLQHAAAVVQDHAPRVVERHPRDRHAAIADRPEHEPDRELLHRPGGPRLERPGRVAWSSFRASRSPATAPASSPTRATGETRNRTTRRRGRPAGARRAYSWRISTFLAIPRSPVRSSSARERASSSTSSGT